MVDKSVEETIKGKWGDTKLKVDLRNILRKFYGQMKELQKTDQPEFNKGLDGICAYDEAIEAILDRTGAPDLYEGLKDALKEICRMCVRLNPQHENCTACEEMERSRQPLLKAEGKGG